MIVANFLFVALLAAAAQLTPNPRLQPNQGVVSLSSGFSEDPYVTLVQAGGELNAASLGPSCVGFIDYPPTLWLDYRAGSLPLILSVAAEEADTTLAVYAPDGRWYCDDDSGHAGLNPMVRFNNPRSGRYAIWVGTWADANLLPAALHISELTSQ
jgi:hypothetical protein